MSRSNISPALQLGQGLDTLATHPISKVPFVSDVFFEREKDIWKDTWLMLGREQDLKETGQYFTFHLKLLNTPIAVTRLRNGTLQAFYNLCSHRASTLLCEKFGKTPAITCRFHGWTYGLDGTLRGIPDPELFASLGDKGKYNLHKIPVASWGGFLFVNLNSKPRYSLQEYLAGLPGKLDTYLGDEKWQWYTGYQMRFKANWKDLLNIQHEGYHASHLHKKTLGVHFKPGDCRNTVFPGSPGVCSLLTVLRPETSQDPRARMTQVQKLSLKYGTTSNWVDQDTSVAATRSEGAINHEKSRRFVFDCYTLFPNLMIFAGMDVLSVMRVWPVNAHESDWEWDWYFKDELKNFGNLFNREHGRIATRNALSEDWPVIECVHENLRCDLLDKTVIGTDMEATVRSHYEKLLEHMGMSEGELSEFK
jgi:phenylpropionate dioxygenase-like ring-hydroxylating dioxygenase large terminal subunit